MKLSTALLSVLMLGLTAGCGDAGDGAGEGEGEAGEGEGEAGEGEGEAGEGEGEAGEGEGEGEAAPTVVVNNPADLAVDVPRDARIAVTFSEEMDAASFDASTFTLTSAQGAVDATVVHLNRTVELRPAALLASDTLFTATITTDAESAAGIALAEDHVFTFTTSDALLPTLLPVNLGTAGTFVILAKTAISTVPPSVVTGDIAVSPAAATFITGFSLTADATNVFSTSPQVTGQVFAADFAEPTPANLTTAVSDMELAFTDAAGRAPDLIELGAGNIGGLTLSPGVYKWGTGLLIPTQTNVTLSGSDVDVWIFQIAQDLTVANGTNVFLEGGALAKNVFWQVAGFVDIGTTAHMEGVVLTQTAVTMQTGSSINGRLLAQTAVTLDASTVVEPAQ